MTKFLLALFLALPFLASAQFKYTFDQSIPFQEEKGRDLSAPWTGGLNAAQYNTMDLNNDGKDDLVIFDRMAGKIITFLNSNNTWQYAPEYENFFPEEIERWVLLRDYNCDGKKDLFTGDALGMKVYKNVSDSHTPKWERLFFSTGFPGSKSGVLLTKGNSGKINLQIQFDDLPSISDVDGDGDLDIFSIRFGGSGAVLFHKNFSMERYGTCDSLELELVNQHWGEFTECHCGEFAFHGHDCSHSGGRTQHAGGKSLLAIDIDGDSHQDLLLSEAECTRMFLMKNEGTLLDPVVNTATAYPTQTPANFLIYPAAYFEDVDFDGTKDLIATPNIYGKIYLNMRLHESNWFYKNTGTNTAPNFVFTKRNLLQETMLDVGDNAVPAFADFDGDGDYDLFISNNDYPATIRLYENVGTASHPKFVFKTDDYLSLSFSSLFNMRMRFADINNDGRIDLVFSARSYLNGSTRIYYFLNRSALGLNFNPYDVQELSFQILSTENFTITDVDRDGRTDLLVGRSNGRLEYWRNTGGLNYTLENGEFLGIGPSVFRQNISGVVADLDGDGNEDLILADQTGQLRIVKNFRKTFQDNPVLADHDFITEIIYNPLTETYNASNLGGMLWPTVANLFNTDKPAIITGTVLGGLRVLRNEEETMLSDAPRVFLYPNPVLKNEVVTARVDRFAVLQVFSATGAEVATPRFIQPNSDTFLRFPDLAPGVYVLRFFVNNKFFSKRLVIY